ncbi:hypothetical protein KUTeg_013868 [Tegillarca granosa]|uniref:Uncharacterized protein n=1 Tax=Tegillarca granosa TaxID=220873 RepID=A0ABQ9EUY9_TEGGR|nr:hypothetical protein KUTeg_013868 [Tegillarca granosa]
MYCFKLYTLGKSSSKPCQLKKIPIGNSQFLTMTMDMFNLKVYVYRDLRDSFGTKVEDTLEGMTIDGENLKTIHKTINILPIILALKVLDGELYVRSINVILSLAGIKTPREVYSWVIVLVLPLNAAINPYIYTFSKLDSIKFSRNGGNYGYIKRRTLPIYPSPLFTQKPSKEREWIELERESFAVLTFVFSPAQY